MTTRQFGVYQVQQKIGAGSLCAVSRAQTADGKAVVLKMPHRELAANVSAVAAFLAATAQWSALTHPHLLPLLDGEIMNFVTGDQPIAEVEGTPVELIERPVLVVPPS